jgi:hypothetical protein
MLRLMLTTCAVVAVFLSNLTAATLTVPEPYSRIQSAIDAAADGDTVLVSPGLYQENVSFRGKALFVCSQYPFLSDQTFIRETIIDGGNPENTDSGSVVIFAANERSGAVLCGFTLVNGIGTAIPGSYQGGGIFIDEGAAPTIIFNTIYGNNALVGGGIAARGAGATIAQNAIYANNAEKGGGIALLGCQAEVRRNVIFGNSDTSQGGGVYCQGAAVSFGYNVVACDSAASGGGIYCAEGAWELQSNNFYDNHNGDFVGCTPADFGDTSWGYNFNRDRIDRYANLFRPPSLTAPEGLDFQIRCDSRLVDAGAKLPSRFPLGGKRDDIGIWEIEYYPGDLNGDLKINLADATVLVNIIFRGAAIPCPTYQADLDCSRKINISDLVALISYWSGQSIPCALNPDRSVEPFLDLLKIGF